MVAGGWYIVFCGVGRRGWFDWFTFDGFRHVLAFGWHEDRETWIVYEPAITGTEIHLLDHDEMDLFLAGLSQEHQATFVFYPHHGQKMRCQWPRFGAYCVSATERILGLRPRALRPYGLYRRLLELGAEPAFEGISHGLRKRRRKFFASPGRSAGRGCAQG